MRKVFWWIHIWNNDLFGLRGSIVMMLLNGYDITLSSADFSNILKFKANTMFNEQANGDLEDHSNFEMKNVRHSYIFFWVSVSVWCLIISYIIINIGRILFGLCIHFQLKISVFAFLTLCIFVSIGNQI